MADSEEQQQQPIIQSYKKYKKHKKPKKKRRSCNLLCCCGPCCTSCIKWLFLCSSLCTAAIIIAIVYMREVRSCCGDPIDLCLMYTSVQQPERYDHFISKIRGNRLVQKNKLHRAFNGCVKEVYNEVGPSCYGSLLTCMEYSIFPNWENDL